MKRLALLAALLTACEFDAPDPYDTQDEALSIADTVFAEHGYDSIGFTLILWYPGDCLPDPWNVGVNGLVDGRCRNGKTLYLIWGCIIAVRIRGTSIADTSLAHELGHHVYLDPWHEWRPLWDVTVPEINRRIWERDL